MNKEIRPRNDYWFEECVKTRKENQKLKVENATLEVERDTYKSKCDNLTNVIFKGVSYNDLVKENQKLVKVFDELEKYCKEEIEAGNKMPAEYEKYGLTDYVKGSVGTYKRILNKLTELKGGSKQ